jgi:hypothetical protein
MSVRIGEKAILKGLTWNSPIGEEKLMNGLDFVMNGT